jgi:hypothetical protein
VKEQKMKRTASIIAAALMMIGASAGAASADATTPPSANGYATARANTVCADHGTFNYLTGPGHNMGVDNTDGVLGADGTQTGINNSTLCGQPNN